MTGSAMGGTAFDRFAGWLSVLAGIAGIGYAVAFVVLKNGPLSALFLTLAPLLAIGGLVAVFDRVRSIEPGFATVALALGAFALFESSGTLGGFPNPPAMVRGEQSSPAPHADHRSGVR